MTEKRLSVRLAAIGGRQVRAELEGIGAAGSEGFRQVAREVDGASLALRRVMGVLGAAVSVRQIVAYADTWTDLRSRVDLATGSQAAGAAVMERLSEMARRTYSSLELTAESFLANATALRELGLTTSESLDFTEALNNALVVSGARAERAASVQDALGKAMALGTLSGQNLNTVIASGGRVAELLAAELGVTVSALRGLGSQGEITGEVIRRALVGNLDLLRDEADSMPATIGDAFTLMGNAALAFVGNLDTVTQASATVAQAIILVADNLDRLAAWAAAAGVLFGGRYVAGLVAARLATMSLSGALVVLRGALIRTGIGALVVAAGELVYQFVRLVQGAGGFGTAMELLGNVAAEVYDRMRIAVLALRFFAEASWRGIKASVLDAVAGALDGVFSFADRAMAVFKGAYDGIVAIWGALPGAIGDFAFAAANTLIGAVEAMLNGVVQRINLFVAGLNAALSLLPDWVTGGSPVAIGEIGEVALGRLDNPFEGQARAAGSAAADAFRAAMGAQTIAPPDFGLEAMAEVERSLSDSAADLGRIFQDGVTAPLTSIEALRDVMAEAADATDDGTEALDRLNDALAEAGGGGGGGGTAGGAANGAAVGLRDVADAIEEVDARARTGAQAVSDMLADVIVRGRSAADVISGLLQKMAEVQLQKSVLGLTEGGFLSGFFGALGGAMTAPSFAGGGYTGTGPRTGGLDGRGGFLALLHPQETVIDHLRGGSARGGGAGGEAVTIHVDVTGANGDRQIMAMVEAGIEAGVARGLAQYDRGMPVRVDGILRDRRMR